MSIRVLEEFNIYPTEIPSTRVNFVAELTADPAWGYPPPATPLSWPEEEFRSPQVQFVANLGPWEPQFKEDFENGHYQLAQALNMAPLLLRLVPVGVETFDQTPAQFHLVGLNPGDTPNTPFLSSNSTALPNGTVWLEWTGSSDAYHRVYVDDVLTKVTTALSCSLPMSSGTRQVGVESYYPHGQSTARSVTSIYVPPAPRIKLEKDQYDYLTKFTVGVEHVHADIPVTRGDDKLLVTFDHTVFAHYYANGALFALSVDGGANFGDDMVIPPAGDEVSFYYPLPDGVANQTELVVRLKVSETLYVTSETVWLNIQPGITSV